MKKYEEKSFDIPSLKGISDKQIEEHLKLYSGYVKHVNLIAEKLESLSKDEAENLYLMNELRRRLPFEFDGMRLHEYYFHSIEGGGKKLPGGSILAKKIDAEYGSFQNWLSECIKISGTRGIGWTILYYDPENDSLMMRWIDEHQIGHLAGLQIVLVVDVWEHAFMVDYLPSQKKEYIENYLSNINWEIVSEDFENKAHDK
jgi:superoxide dismutase, Fe-Mn family